MTAPELSDANFLPLNRRDWLKLAAGTLAAAPFIGGYGRAADSSKSRGMTGEDWPRWRGPRGDGTWHGPELADKFPAKGLVRVWERECGGGYAGVTVTGNLACVCDRLTAPAEIERIRALNVQHGGVEWTHEYPVAYEKLDYGSGPRAAPTVHDGRLYSLGAVGHLVCLDAAKGTLLWSKHLREDLGGKLSTWGYSASPFIVDDLVIVQPGGDKDNSLVALDRLTGETRWSVLNDPAGYATPILVDHAGQRQLVCWTPTFIRSVDPTTGELFWSVPYEVTYGVSIATPVCHNGIVLVCGYWEGSKAVRLADDPRESKLMWEENRYLRGLMSQPLCRGEHAYLLDKSLGLTCFEIETGKKVWDDRHQLTPRDRNPQATLVWLGDSDRAIALNADGDLVLMRLSPEGYQELDRTNIIGPTWAHPAYAGDCLFARDDKRIICARLPLAKGE